MRMPDQPGPYVGETCTICDKTADAMWSGMRGDVFICAHCAINTLPRLIADAFFSDVRRRLREPVQHDIERAFYRGLCDVAFGELRRVQPTVPLRRNVAGGSHAGN